MRLPPRPPSPARPPTARPVHRGLDALKRSLLERLIGSAAGTQEELAAELGISYATLHAWKTGRREVPDSALETMARLALRRSRELEEAASDLLEMASGAPSGSDDDG